MENIVGIGRVEHGGGGWRAGAQRSRWTSRGACSRAPAPGGPPGANVHDLVIAQLMEGRYVNINGDPLPAGTPHDEFKMMPVHIKLLIREERLPKLLVECGNSRTAHRDSPGDANGAGAGGTRY